jgi:hypothetical protein
MTTQSYNVPLVVRGSVVEADDLQHGGRGGSARFSAPDIRKHVKRMQLSSPSAMSDLYTLNFEDILDYLDDLGRRLSLANNPWLQDAFELSCHTSGLGRDILSHMYGTIGALFARGYIRELAERTIGVDYLSGWVENRTVSGVSVRVRAFGARSVHVIAGNSPGVAALTVARNALTRGDAIIKTPSNDPLTASAIARTMIDMAPDHPLTRHLTVAYWKGGDAEVEDALYLPSNIEKIIAWGGMASIKHITKYIQPGIELVALDPKLSSTIIGREAFADEATQKRVASLLAVDVGSMNQEACVNARVVYVESGTDEVGIRRLNAFGAHLWDALKALPLHLSGPAVRLDPSLQEEIEALQTGGDEFYKVIGGGRTGAVIISQIDEPVDFARSLANRVANLVPIDDLDVPVSAVTTYTQTIGIYPESLKLKLRDRLALQGAQRLVTLGHAMSPGNHGIQDGIEPLRRMCRWIVDEQTGDIPLQTAVLSDDALSAAGQ